MSAPRPLAPHDLRPAAHVVVTTVDAPDLEADDAHHLGRVLRLRPGQLVTVTDGAGAWRPCRWRNGSGLDVDGDVVIVERLRPAISVALALTKGDQPELAVQKLTEFGVDEIVLFAADRSIVRWDGARVERNLTRLRAIARGAVEQSRSCWLPAVAAVDGVAALAQRGMTRAEPGGDPPSLARPAVAVGPEGGWSQREQDLLPVCTGLHPGVLRSETAALTAGALLCALRADLVRDAAHSGHGA